MRLQRIFKGFTFRTIYVPGVTKRRRDCVQHQSHVKQKLLSFATLSNFTRIKCQSIIKHSKYASLPFCAKLKNNQRDFAKNKND
jgi:hypothetical protein